MSLKSFHLVFVTVSTLLFAFLVLWAFGLSGESGAVAKTLGGVGVAGIVVMITYGVYFYRKIQRTEALANSDS